MFAHKLHFFFLQSASFPNPQIKFSDFFPVKDHLLTETVTLQIS